ncbi:hypothetical protein PG993_000731 [Apiospora rasikravindrae]|uniref:Myelin basic protein n=1 Tax=Apiospora rasikravindrae TaxID=990691 RepID=A0ABR1UC74_9PEZI
MAKTKWWSHGRKPSTSSGENETAGTGTVTPDSEGQEPGSKSPSRFIRTLTGFRPSRSSKKDKASRGGGDDGSYAHLERPFTQQNLEHQKILNAFAFSFGSSKKQRRTSHGAHSHMSGISPCASRNTSVDGASLSATRSHGSDRRETHPRFSSSLAHNAPQEVPGEESDQERGPVHALPNAPKVARVVSNHS